jgi:hypothetical protein
MIALVHAAPSTLERYRRSNLGVLCSPRRFYRDVEGWRWAADNDAYSDWSEARFRRMLGALRGLPGCLFVTAPDVVGDAEATNFLFYEWLPKMRVCGQPVAYVTQDGLHEPPWGEFEALFIGGSDEWKMGEANRALVVEAKRRGLWVHMGRVNGHQRIRYAKAIGCDSFDGTSMSWFRDRWLNEYAAHAGDGAVQGLLV